MLGLIKKTVLGAAMAASTLAATAPAQAQYYRGGYRHHDGIGAGGAAVLGGILGLGVGAAIASSNNRNHGYDNRYYDRGYYNAPRGYYQDSYRYNDYQPRCFYERQYDRYTGRPYDVRICR